MEFAVFITAFPLQLKSTLRFSCEPTNQSFIKLICYEEMADR